MMRSTMGRLSEKKAWLNSNFIVDNVRFKETSKWFIPVCASCTQEAYGVFW